MEGDNDSAIVETTSRNALNVTESENPKKSDTMEDIEEIILSSSSSSCSSSCSSCTSASTPPKASTSSSIIIVDSDSEHSGAKYRISSIQPDNNVAMFNYPGEELTVECIRQAKVFRSGRRRFMVKWMGFPDWENSWEWERDVPRSIVEEFDAQGNSGNKTPPETDQNDEDIFDELYETDLTPDMVPLNIIGFKKNPNNEVPLDEGVIFFENLQIMKLFVNFNGDFNPKILSYTLCKRLFPDLLIHFFETHFFSQGNI